MLYKRIQIFMIIVVAVSTAILAVQYLRNLPTIIAKIFVCLIAFVILFTLSIGLLAHYLPRWKYYEITLSILQFLYFAGWAIYLWNDSSQRQYLQQHKIWPGFIAILWTGLCVSNAYFLVKAIAKHKLPHDSRHIGSHATGKE
jgi:uncharacterized membrane protein YfhO